MISILKKEISSYLGSLIGYLVIATFIISTGLFTWIFPDSSVLNGGFSELRSFFNIAPFVFLFIVPAITMRQFSEEFRSGTIELLFTKPLTINQIVSGKYFSSVFIIGLMLIFSLIFYVSIYQLGSPVGNIDTAAVAGSYFGLLLIGAVFSAIGLLTSAFTNNQIIAFIVAVFINFCFFVGISSISSLFEGSLSVLLENLSLNYHYEALGRGLIDSRNLIYMVSIIFFCLVATGYRLDKLRK